MGISKTNRIKRDLDFKEIIEARHSYANRFFIVYIKKREDSTLGHWRAGLSVSKKVGKAHERVWVKRRIRASLMNLEEQIDSNIDMVVIARPTTNGIEQHEAQKQLVHIFKNLGVLNE
ncbi:MAG: ribonuclease P protein component [Lactobacillaceae bacterium]|jgi:ribonuclease P protein component|nr:ribonuclease P protein component [Lactobacillaceae bacterium]